MKYNISALKGIIFENLHHEIDRDYVLLELPNYRNIGDSLIWEGEEEFLNTIKYKCKYRCSLHFYEREKIGQDDIILLTGGGNFGDLWEYSQMFRRMIIKNHMKNKIIIFPQTVYYKSDEIAYQDAKLFSEHGDILICARDQRSFNFISEVFIGTKVKLVPDMAFYIDIKKYFNSTLGDDTLYMIRNDKELKLSEDLNRILQDPKLSLLDWPTYPKSNFLEFVLSLLERTNNFLGRNLLKVKIGKKFVHPIYGLNPFNMRKLYIQLAVKFFSKYKYIHTTRLHGHILAILMDIPHTFYENSYGKNSQFFNTWTKDFKGVTFIN